MKNNMKIQAENIIKIKEKKYKDLKIYETIVNADNKKHPKDVESKLVKPCKKINLYEIDGFTKTSIKQMIKKLSK